MSLRLTDSGSVRSGSKGTVKSMEVVISCSQLFVFGKAYLTVVTKKAGKVAKHFKNAT